MAARSRGWAVAVAAAVVTATAVSVPTASQAAPASPAAPAPVGQPKVDRTLGNGLGRLLAAQAGTSQRRAAASPIDQEALTIRDARGRVLVDLTPAKGVDRAAFRSAAEAAGLEVQSTDPGAGTLEGFVALDDVTELHRLPGRGTLAQAVRPRTSVGAVDSAGVALQRVDRAQATGLDGTGVTIGALSDSYDTATRTLGGGRLTVRAADDVASGDLPGPGNPTNPRPVVVLEDTRQGGTVDEGRAMLQIAHDVAPQATLCFATALTGAVGFAANIRRLADPEGDCRADVVVDDILYYDEPMFSDGIVSDAVDAVAEQGVHYLSAAGNEGSYQAWESGVHVVSAAQVGKTSNVDLGDVDPALYDGGFQDMRPGTGIDVAQTVAIGPGGGLIDLQWDDPVDLDGPTVGASYAYFEGVVSSSEPRPRFTFTPTAEQLGKEVQFRLDAIPSRTSDLVLSVTAPDGTVLGTVDDTSTPELLSATLDQPGDYTIGVSGFAGETGDFTLDVAPVLAPSSVTTDFNLLLFDTAGRFLGAVADDNRASGRPLELTPLTGDLSEVQVVVSRSGTGQVGATRVRAVLFGGAELTENVDITDPSVFGHATARGATAVAAYDPFRPFLPEPFSAVGGRLTLTYDSAGRRLDKSQQTRTVPQVAGVDGVNTTFFGQDTDRDGRPNFFGTSAAAPQVAGIAALLVQQADEQGRTLSPAALRNRLQDAAFDHDRDPFVASGKAGGVVVGARGAQSPESDPVPGSMTDPRFFTVTNTGSKTVRSVTLDGSTASPTAVGPKESSRFAGIVFDPRRYDADEPRSDMGFPFTIGATGGGLARSGVKASYAGPTGDGRYRRLTLTFAKGLKKGQRVEFGVDRDLARAEDGSVSEGNGADELGGAVDLPSGTQLRGGLTLTVKPTSGRSAKATMANRLGAGWTAVDGYGLVDAEEATVGR